MFVEVSVLEVVPAASDGSCEDACGEEQEDGVEEVGEGL